MKSIIIKSIGLGFFILYPEIVKLRVIIRKVKEYKFNYLRLEEA